MKSAIILFITICLLKLSSISGLAQSNRILYDDFDEINNNWLGLNLNGNGSFSFTDGCLDILLNSGEQYGVYHSDALTGHFYIEIEFKEDKNVALALLKNKDGVPDTENYTMIRVDQNNDEQTVVSINDKQANVQNVLDHTSSIDKSRYEHTLTGNTYSVPFTETNRKLRIVRHESEKMFHFYYSVEKDVKGKIVSDWMELAPSPEWGDANDSYFLALVSTGEIASFEEVSAYSVPVSDQSDVTTGFKAIWREYNWSGYFGDALVVSFGEQFDYQDEDKKFVFWDQCNYIPTWHINNATLYSYEFVETWGGGSVGCFEPMSDRLLRFSNVEVIEDNDVRKVVKWRYVLLDPDYKVPNDSEGSQLPEVEETYVIYCDGSIIRSIKYFPKLDSDFRNWHELTELIVIAGDNNWPKDLLDNPALTIFDLDGDKEQVHPTGGQNYANDNRLGPVALIAHLKNEPDVFNAFSDDMSTSPTHSGFQLDYKLDWHDVNLNFSHWPVNKEPYAEPHKSWADWKEQIAHTSLIGMGVYGGQDWTSYYQQDNEGRIYREWISLNGLHDKNDTNGIRDKTNSWLYTGNITLSDDSSRYVGYDYGEKLFEFEVLLDVPASNFTIEPESDLVDPVIRVKGWGDNDVHVNINGEELEDSDRVYTIEDNDLLLYIKGKYNGANTIQISSNQIVLAVDDLIEEDYQLNVYPNPVKDSNLHVNIDNGGKEYYISLLDISGVHHYRNQHSNSLVRINTDHLGKGMYILQIRMDSSIFTKKIIIV